jgi:hypothetical protein
VSIPVSNSSDRPLTAGEHEVIELPNVLAEKAGAFRASQIDSDRLDRTIARVIRNYAEVAAPRLTEMRECWERIRTGRSLPDDVKLFAKRAHDFKGEGASFGFPLVTEISRSLCLLLECGAATVAKAHPPIEAHVAAIEAVLKNNIQGDGGEIGRAIVADLRKAVRKAGPS